MIRGLSAVVGAAVLALWASEAAAQAPFQAGQVVTATTAPNDTACLSQESLEKYISAKEGCPQGDTDSCSVAKDLESRDVCGVHFDSYVVVSVDRSQGWMQISPVSDQSTVFWADARDFKPVD